MNSENTSRLNNKEEALLGILSELDNIGCSEKTGKAIAITKDLIKTQSKLQNRNEDLVKEKELLLNAKEEWEKEKKRLIAHLTHKRNFLNFAILKKQLD